MASSAATLATPAPVPISETRRPDSLCACDGVRRRHRAAAAHRRTHRRRTSLRPRRRRDPRGGGRRRRDRTRWPTQLRIRARTRACLRPRSRARASTPTSPPRGIRERARVHAVDAALVGRRAEAALDRAAAEHEDRHQQSGRVDLPRRDEALQGVSSRWQARRDAHVPEDDEHLLGLRHLRVERRRLDGHDQLRRPRCRSATAASRGTSRPTTTATSAIEGGRTGSSASSR